MDRKQEPLMMTEKPINGGSIAGPRTHLVDLQARRTRTGLASTLIALQALLATGAGATTLSITRAEVIREKMAKSNLAIPQNRTDAPVREAQNWGNWSNWGNWPGWVPRGARKWRW